MKLRALLAALLLATTAACAAGTAGGSSRNSGVITEAEIRASGAGNAFELVESLRPMWLRVRGTQNFREERSIRGAAGKNMKVQVTDPGDQGILVYVDNARIGGLEAMRQISPGAFVAAKYFDARAATLRWGTGHEKGVILLSTTPLDP